MNNNIENIRQNLNMTRRELADSLGLTIQAVFNYEKGSRNPSVKVCYRLISLAKKNGFDLKLEDIYLQESA
jgi:DNA-binding XRE family transcriptional regulator